MVGSLEVFSGNSIFTKQNVTYIMLKCDRTHIYSGVYVCVCFFFLQWTALHSAYMLGKTKSIEYWIDFFQRTAHRTSIHWNSNVDLDIFFFEFYVNLIGSVQIRRFLLMKMEFSLVQFEMHVNTHTHTQWERFKWINIEHSEYEEKKKKYKQFTRFIQSIFIYIL